jgi:ankyrin repeat protein
MTRLLDRGIDINTTDTDGNNILMNYLLTINDHLNTQDQINNMIRDLVFNRHININTQNTEGNTALNIALEPYYYEENSSFEIIDILLGHTEINRNIQNNSGQTALMLAAETGIPDVVRLILNADLNVNLNVNLTDRYGSTAMDYTGIIEIINMLIDAGGTPTDYAIYRLITEGALTERIKRLKNKEILENTIIPHLNIIRLQNPDENPDKNPYVDPYISSLISNSLLYPIDGKKKVN